MDLPVGLRTTATGVELTFTDPLDPSAAADPHNYAVKVWDLVRSQDYGSKHINEHSLPVARAILLADGKTVHLDIPGLAPSRGMEIKLQLQGADGRPIVRTIHNTIHHLGP